MTIENLAERVQAFADLILTQRQAELRRQYPDSDMWQWEAVNVHPGKLYTKVDVGPRHNMSGKYMVEHATGIIYGIKGYGRVHKGYRYGTLDTTDEWYWGGHYGRKAAS